ncbi:DUF7507 domain-containing protein [Zhengella mangrovi]|uniref:DUF7507 domain-containing protein n=1 Tax=Zhengella mangrovi TaxID=1982044 RepID=UPI0013FDAA0C|nr:DUF642 domain-containing protein [Zhengella mangrovi]
MSVASGLALAILLGLPAQAGAAELLVNGGFEGTPATVDRNVHNATAPLNWSFANGTTDIFSAATTFGSYTWQSPPDAGDFVHGLASPTYNESILQSVTGLTPGKTYELTFSQATSFSDWSAVGNQGHWVVSLGTQSQAASALTVPATGVALAWQQQSMLFTATSTTQSLVLKAVVDSGNRIDLGIDSVSLQPYVPPFTITAVDDVFSSAPIMGGPGGSTTSVHVNDTVNGAAVDPAAIVTTIVSDGGLTGVSVDADGLVHVPAGTASGSYTLRYRICDPQQDPAIGCAEANATVLVVDTPPAGAASCSGTNLLANGGFEAPVYPAPPSANSAAAVSGWSTADASVTILDHGYQVQQHTGTQAAILGTGLSTTLTGFNPRSELRVHWAHRGLYAGDAAQLLLTDDAGGSLGDGPYTPGTAAWQVHSRTYVPGAGATSLAMQFLDTGGLYNNVLDTVEVCQTYLTLAKAEGTRTDVDSSGGDSAGDTISYIFTIANPAGNEVALGGVTLVDDRIGTVSVTTPASGDTNGNGLLDPGETWTVSASDTLTQADLDAGSVTNIAHAEAGTGANTIRSGDAQVTATLARQPALVLAKTWSFVTDANGDGKAGSGDVIRYAYAVTNTGNVSVAGVSVSDTTNGNDPAFLGGASPGQPVTVSLTTDAGTTGDSTDADNAGPVWDTLAPGDTVTFTADYSVVQADVDALQ